MEWSHRHYYLSGWNGILDLIRRCRDVNNVTTRVFLSKRLAKLTWQRELDKNILLWNYFRLIKIVWSNVGKCIGRTRFCTGFLEFIFLKNFKTLKSQYCCPVRPKFEYAFQMWNSYTMTNIKHIESVQRRATRFILKSDDEYLVRLRKLCLLSLENRRFIADVVFFCKLINNHNHLALDHLTLDSTVCFCRNADRGYTLRRMDTLNLLPCHSRTNLLKFSFINRIVGEWNCLPPDVR